MRLALDTAAFVALSAVIVWVSFFWPAPLDQVVEALSWTR